MSELVRIDETSWEIPATARADMRVPARIFADEEILAEIAGDLSLDQLRNVATLPGVVGAAIAMPDIHQGYGFPVGGVAATELPDGVVSPGGFSSFSIAN
jgi:tRNA-splicing ligase RtcB